MKSKSLQLIFVGILFCTTTVFANVQINERKNFRKSEMNADLFLFREHAKLEMRTGRTPISTRQSNTATHRLDSVIFAETNRREKIEWTYDSNGNIISWIVYEWNNLNNTWRGLRKGESMFDDSGNRTKWIFYTWNNWGNRWVERDREEFTYDSNGNLTEQILYSFGVWREKEKFEHDDYGNLTTRTLFSWWNDAWNESDKENYTYDNNGNLIVRAFYIWFENAWEEWGKDEFTYDSNDNMIMQISHRWSSGRVSERYKREYTYDDDGNLIMEILSDRWWGNPWREIEKDEYMYDSNGNMIMQISYGWWSSYGWREWRKEEYTYDLSVSLNDIFFPDNLFEVIFFNNKITDAKWHSRRENVWQEATITFFYSQIQTNIPSITKNSFTIFPNPVFDNFTISGIAENTFVKITDLNGRIVLQQTIAPNEQISVGHLSAGVYFVRVNEETMKIVKK